jgi:hypothetical protein
MPKFTVFSLIVIAAFNIGLNAQQRWPQYPKVEAYEVRPGVLMIPRYTASSEVCEFGLEALQYSPDLIRVNSELSGEQIFQLLDELIPGSDRGKPLKKSDTQISQRGRSVVITTTSDYENVVIRVYAAQSAHENGVGERMDGLVATVKWKQRQCRP